MKIDIFEINVIEDFGGLFFGSSRCFLDFYFGVGAFVIGLSQLSSLFSFRKILPTDNLGWSVITPTHDITEPVAPIEFERDAYFSGHLARHIFNAYFYLFRHVVCPTWIWFVNPLDLYWSILE